MTGTPPPPPHKPAGDAPDHGDDEGHAARPGQHESHTPQSPDTSTGPGRHEMAGAAGYPQFEGPGAAQYGNEPVEPPPPVAPPQQPGYAAQPGYQGQPGSTAQPGYSTPPSYGPPGTGPGTGNMPPGAMPPPGTMPPESMPPQGNMPYGSPPQGTQPGMMPPPQDSGQPTYGYQQAAHTAPGTLDVGQALSYGWEKFRRNPGPWMGVIAAGLVIYLGFVLVVQLTDPTTMLPLLLIFLAVLAAVWLLQAAMVRGALYETDGNKPHFGSYFRFINAGNVLITALLSFILTFIGSAICILPGLVVGVLCMFSLHFVVDQNEGPFEALKSSATLVVTNVWPVLLLALAVLFVTLVGALLCGLGLLVAGPVAIMAVTYAYRTLTGGAVSPI
ncbi:hypothetical protein ACQPW1_33635 [Nocardia sp. CA-128927]|uniref:hypothetical protein n=1 Tax=Nocardia sp. CA-128927 TaxID=3239975 RepID=UPI003D952A9E